jgi:hypothetical protein
MDCHKYVENRKTFTLPDSGVKSPRVRRTRMEFIQARGMSTGNVMQRQIEDRMLSTKLVRMNIYIRAAHALSAVATTDLN